MFAYKVVLVGDFGTGKSSLVKRFVDNTFSEDYISSIGVSIARKQVSTQDTDSTMMLWDIEGKTDFKPIFKQYLLGAKAFIIVADLTREKTLESIKEHIQLCEDTVPNLPICIALNKVDIKSVNFDSDELLKHSPNIIKVYTTSAKSGDAVNEMFEALNKSVIERNSKC